jgi:superoxide dismutase, Fe-Mn family
MCGIQQQGDSMSFELPELPYAQDALAPHISAETFEYHYGKHHAAYVKKLNELITDTEFAELSLDDILLKSTGGIFNNAAQHWNHSFYWNCLTPEDTKPSAELEQALIESFGSVDDFCQKFSQAAATQFGSGWAWLVKDASGKLEIVTTSNADNPMTRGQKPLLTCDVWEHAYYIDTRNNRAEYIQNFWKIVNWDFVATNLKNA